MSKSAKPAVRKPVNKPSAKSSGGLGALPEWNLNDLYPGLDSPKLKSDLEQADNDCTACEEAFKGKLQAMASGEGAGKALAEAVKRYEVLEDKLGRLYSYASLL